MPTFKEKCPEFGQKINVDGNDKDCFFICKDADGDFKVQYNGAVYFHSSSEEWISVSQEPQWTQITEDESTWPPELTLVVIDSYCGFRNGKIISAKSISRNTSEYEIEQLYGAHWTHIPKRKKEEKTHLSDGSEVEEKLFKLEMDVKFLKEKIGLFEILKKEKSPWIYASMKPMHGNEVLVRSKLSTGEFIYGIGCIFRGDWNWPHCVTPEEWMEIPK